MRHLILIAIYSYIQSVITLFLFFVNSIKKKSNTSSSVIKFSSFAHCKACIYFQSVQVVGKHFVQSVKVQSELPVSQPKNYIFVKTEYRMVRIDFQDVLYIEGMGAYLRIVTSKGKITTLLSFAQIEKQLPTDKFRRVHKSYIVAIDKIKSIERNVIVVDNERIPIGKTYLDDFYQYISV